jgi:hypothetical protein
LLDALPKVGTFNARYYRDTVLAKLIPLRPQVDGSKLVIDADNARPTQLNSAELFVSKTSCGSPHTLSGRLVSHHPTSFSSDMSNIVCRELLFYHKKSYMQQLDGVPEHWMKRLNEFLKIIATTIHMRNIG